jgi:hypothetical protein
MDTTLTIAIIGATVSIIGWMVNHILSTSSERRREKLNFQIEFTKQQLEELYGPLAFLILEGRRTFQDLLAALGRNHVFLGNNPLLEKELKTWLFWAENDFLPRNGKIKELISSKTYLIEGSEVPESWLAFLDHANSWKINHERWKKEGIEYSWHSRTNWPNQFENDVISTFELLKKRHATLVGRRTG